MRAAMFAHDMLAAGSVDVIVAGKDAPHPLDVFVRTISINLVGTFNAIRLAAAAMEKGPLLNFEWVGWRVKGGREPGAANP